MKRGFAPHKICPDVEAGMIVLSFFLLLIQMKGKKPEQTPVQVVEVNRGITVAELCQKLETDLGN